MQIVILQSYAMCHYEVLLCSVMWQSVIMVSVLAPKKFNVISSQMLIQQTLVANMLRRVLFLSLPNRSNQTMPNWGQCYNTFLSVIYEFLY
jgi:hypothetical protein